MTLGTMPNFNLVYLTVLEIIEKNNAGETTRFRKHMSICIFLVLVY